MPKIMQEFEAKVRGKRIVKVGYLLMDGEVWPCLLLNDGTTILAQRDDEGNGPGVFSHSGSDVALLCETRIRPEAIKAEVGA